MDWASPVTIVLIVQTVVILALIGAVLRVQTLLEITVDMIGKNRVLTDADTIQEYVAMISQSTRMAVVELQEIKNLQKD